MDFDDGNVRDATLVLLIALVVLLSWLLGPCDPDNEDIVGTAHAAVRDTVELSGVSDLLYRGEDGGVVLTGSVRKELARALPELWEEYRTWANEKVWRVRPGDVVQRQGSWGFALDSLLIRRESPSFHGFMDYLRSHPCGN